MLEVVADKRLKQKLIATFKAMGVQEIPGLDVLFKGLKKVNRESTKIDLTTAKLKVAIKRLTMCSEKSICAFVKARYTSKLKDAKAH